MLIVEYSTPDSPLSQATGGQTHPSLEGPTTASSGHNGLGTFWNRSRDQFGAAQPGQSASTVAATNGSYSARNPAGDRATTRPQVVGSSPAVT